MKKSISIFLISILLTGCFIRLTENQRINLNSQLNEMVKVDQVATNLPTGKYLNYDKEDWSKFRDSVHKSITVRIEKIFNEYGFLGYNKLGKEGSNNFWLLVQHSDKNPTFQNKVLQAMNKEVKKGNADAGNYAYLYDRVKVNAGEKQKFGTQLSFDSLGKPFPKIGLIDSAKVDKFRKAYKLEPLKDYYDFIITYRNQKK